MSTKNPAAPLQPGKSGIGFKGCPVIHRLTGREANSASLDVE